jgi:hypothetical protein
VRNDGFGIAGGEEQSDSAGEVWVQKMKVRSAFGFGGGAQCDCHDFGFSEEQTAGLIC